MEMGLVLLFFRRERGCLWVPRYLLGRVSSQKVEKVRLHTQKATGPSAQRSGRVQGSYCGKLPRAFGSTVLLPAGRLGLLGERDRGTSSWGPRATCQGHSDTPVSLRLLRFTREKCLDSPK